MIQLLQGDCLDLFHRIPDQSIDMVLVDPPYGITNCTWNSAIPLNKYIIHKDKKRAVPMCEKDWILNQAFTTNHSVHYLRDKFREECKLGVWDHLKRIVKFRGTIVIMANQPWTTTLIASNRKMFKYSLIWGKNKVTNFLNAKKQPLRCYEDICVFYNALGTYNPQKTDGHKPVNSYAKRSDGTTVGKTKYGFSGGGSTERYPKNIIRLPVVNNDGSSEGESRVHPTQKPLALMEYLILTYSNSQDTILDFCMGSGTTGVAAKKMDRSFVGIELDASYFEIARQRIGQGYE